MKNISLYIIITLLTLVIIYQNNTKEEIVSDTTQNLSYQKVENCNEKDDSEILEEVIENHTNKKQLDDDQAIAKAKNSLKLTRVDENGVSIKWSVDTEDNIKLIATLFKNNHQDTKVFNFKVNRRLKKELENKISEKITDDLIKVENENLEEVTTNLNLPETGIDGSKIIWESSEPNVISNRGVVIRPSFNQDEVTVTLRATIISKDGQEKEFSVTVMPDESEIRESRE